MKKLLTLALPLLVLSALLSQGCNGATSESSGPVDQTQTSASPKTDAPAPETAPSSGGGAVQNGGVEVKKASDPGPG
jgi:hypothetical protein